MIERTALLKAMERPTIDLGDKFNYDEKKKDLVDRSWDEAPGGEVQVPTAITKEMMMSREMKSRNTTWQPTTIIFFCLLFSLNFNFHFLN